MSPANHAFRRPRARFACEIAALRYRFLHVAARQARLRIDKAWRWATAIAMGWGRIRTACG